MARLEPKLVKPKTDVADPTRANLTTQLGLSGHALAEAIPYSFALAQPKLARASLKMHEERVNTRGGNYYSLRVTLLQPILVQPKLVQPKIYRCCTC